MNVKTAFGHIGDVIGGLAGVLAGLVSVGVLSQIVFGTGWLGIDVISNISGIVASFLGGGLTGLITLIVLLSLWDNK
jgi:hypothetical protein